MTTVDRPSAPERSSVSRKRRVRQAVGPGVRVGRLTLWIVVVFNVLIFTWLLMSSFKDTREIFLNPWSLPSRLEFGNYSTAWVASKFAAAAINTVVVVAAASVLIVVIGAPAAYALSRVTSRWVGPLTAAFAIGMGIPFQVVLIPLFVVMSRLGLVDSLVGLTVLYVALSLPFTVILLTGFFGTLPLELEESASLDGASSVRTFITIMLPLARTGLLTAFLLNAIGLWNETFIALVFLQSSDRQTLSLALLGFMQRQQYNGADWGGLFAGVVILVTPMVVLYLWLGRRIIEGLTLGVGK